MNEQKIILIFLLLFTAVTLCLYEWKAKKEMEYKKDERWQFIQYKAIKIADISNYSILIMLIFIVSLINLFSNINLDLSLNRVLTLAILFIGLRNTIEFIALLIIDKNN